MTYNHCQLFQYTSKLLHADGRHQLKRRILLATTASLFCFAGASIAHAQTTSTAVEEVTVVARAVHVSPSAVPVDQVQPTSTIQREFIQNNIIPLASFDDIVKFSPSVADQSPNGPGLGKSETLSIRGFQDGQFNVTFDGIPFGDSTDLHHTSSALFIAHDIGEAQIDRGPGTASTIGNATFGGSMNFVTKAPLNQFTLNPYATYGSFNTAAGGLEIDTGAGSPIGKAFFDGQYETSDGYLTHASERRTNLMFKDVYEANDRLTFTVQVSTNHAFEYTTQGATLANIQAYGRNYGLGSNPNTQTYYGYQPSNYYSDFEYLDAKWKISENWTLKNTFYSDSFTHYYTESKDASDTNPADNGVTYYKTTPVGSKLSPQPAGAASDVPGKLTNAEFRAFGDILRVTGDLPFGQLKAGVWLERNYDQRYSEGTDLTAGNIPVVGKYGTPYTYDFSDNLTTIQPFVELDWKVTPDLTLTPGVRYSNFQRELDALFNKVKPPGPAHDTENYESVQPSVSAQYKIQTGWDAYVQAAKGFLAPPINVLEVAGAAPSIKPEETWNYQVGTSFHRGRWILGLDAYYIDFSNFITSQTTGGFTTYINGGGAIYQGVEYEGQYVLDHGFSLYTNATFNSAKYKHSSVWLAEAPQWTAAAGLLYDDHHGPYASIIAKWIGSRYGLDVPLSGAGLGNSFGFDPYVTADLAAGWRFRNLNPNVRDVTISLKMSNIFDNRVINDYAGQQSATSAAFPYGAPLFWTMAGRSVFVNLSASF